MPGPLVDTAEGVLEEVRGLLVEVIGEEYLLDIEVEPGTSFHDDLEIESIEFVALAEKLLERYGDQVDFVGWLAEKELDEIIAMTVGDLVDYIASGGSAAPGRGPNPDLLRSGGDPSPAAGRAAPSEGASSDA